MPASATPAQWCDRQEEAWFYRMPIIGSRCCPFYLKLARLREK